VAAKLKVGAIGIGGIFNAVHSEALLEHPDVEVVAACDIVRKKARKFAKSAGVKHVFKDYRELLALDEIDAVDICTPNVLHSEMSVAALEAGKHVLCEKPDAISLAEARKMARAAERSGKVLMVVRNNRFRPDAAFLKRYIEAGHMGEVYTGRCGWIRRRGIPGKGSWFTTKADSGGGPLIDLGVHIIDLAVWLMGHPRPVSVVGATYRGLADSETSDSVVSEFGEAVEDGVFDVEDLATGFLRFDNGATLQIEFSWGSNVEGERNFVELRGTRAGCCLPSDGEVKIFTEIAGTLCDILPRPARPALGQHAMNVHHFVDCALGRAEPIFTPQQGVDMIGILSAIYESAETGNEVKL